MKRQISFTQALATVVGTVIGAGVFFKIGIITQQTGSPSLTLLVWVVAGIISIASGLTVSEVAAALPVNGTMEYLDYTYGKVWGFLFGWAQMIVYFPAQIGALSTIFGTQFVSLFGLPNKMQMPIALILVTFLLAINLIGTRVSSKMQSVITVLKVIPIALIIIWGIFFNHAPVGMQIFPVVTGAGKNFVTALSAGLLSALFAYEGWINVTNLASEVKRPEKDLSGAIILGLAATTLIYLLINFTFMNVLPSKEIIGNSNTAFYSSIKLFGNIGGKLVTIGILISVYGAANGFLLTGIRTPWLLAKNKMIPFHKVIGRANITTGVPVASALIIYVISMIMVVLGSFDILSDMLVFVMWTFTTLFSISVIVLRHREPELKRPFKVPLYPIIPIISIVGGLFVVISTIINQFVLSAVGLGLTLLGLPIYFYMQHKNK